MSESENDRINREHREQRLARMTHPTWTPSYSYWRHGGSYVTNIVYPSGAVGCIASAAHTRSKRFESACFDLGTFKTRDAAAYAERSEAIRQWRELESSALRAAMAPVRNAKLATALDSNAESDWADFWASDAVGR